MRCRQGGATGDACARGMGLAVMCPHTGLTHTGRRSLIARTRRRRPPLCVGLPCCCGRGSCARRPPGQPLWTARLLVGIAWVARMHTCTRGVGTAWQRLPPCAIVKQQLLLLLLLLFLLLQPTLKSMEALKVGTGSACSPCSCCCWDGAAA